MDSAILATVIGVLLTGCFAAFAGAFTWLRADMRHRHDQLDTKIDRLDDKVDARFDKVDARFERLEGKVDDLIKALGRSGRRGDSELKQKPPRRGRAEPGANDDQE